MRLIDADELIKEINNRCESAIKWGKNAIADHNEEIKIRAEQTIATFCEASLTAKKMPTIDAVEVVRCKDCRWFNDRLKRDGTEDNRYAPSICTLHGRPHSNTYFCANGEVKE